MSSFKSRLQKSIQKTIIGRLLNTKGTQPRVDVGFFSKDQYPDGTYVATVAFWNEFGTKSSPPRPFMRTAIEDHKKEWAKTLGSALSHTDGDIPKSLEFAGMKMQADIQDSIIHGDFEKNSPLTNLLKDRFPKGDYTPEDFLTAVRNTESGETGPDGKPLVWTGKMLQSVTYQVET